MNGLVYIMYLIAVVTLFNKMGNTLFEGVSVLADSTDDTQSSVIPCTPQMSHDRVPLPALHR